MLHLYSQAFIGFDLLQREIGPFNVTEDMVGINSAGIVKVWVNSDFGSSQPERAFQLGSLNEADMVRSIVEMVDVNTYHQVLPANIKQHFLLRNPQTFAAALQVLQEYASVHRTLIPPRLDCVL